LDSLDESGVSLSTLLDDSLTLSGLRKDGNDGNTRVSTDDGNVGFSGEGTGNGGEEGGGSNDVEGGDSEETFGVIDTSVLEDFSANGNGGVDRVGNYTNSSFGGEFGGGNGKVTNDGSVGVEEIITSHSRLAGYTSGDNDDVGVSESVLESIVLESVSSADSGSVNVRDVSSYSRATTDIVQSELSDERVLLEEER
jgi:hypothetical protein